MKRILYNGVWPCALAAAIVVCARYLHPATFSAAVFPLLVLLATICAAFRIATRRYE